MTRRYGWEPEHVDLGRGERLFLYPNPATRHLDVYVLIDTLDGNSLLLAGDNSRVEVLAGMRDSWYRQP